MSYTELLSKNAQRYESWYVYMQDHGGELRKAQLFFPDHVLVEGSYYDPEEWRVTPLDIDGNCMVRVNMPTGTMVYDEEEASLIMQCIDADQALLDNAY